MAGTIVGMVFNQNTITTDAPVGTEVGTVTITTSDGTAFSGALSLAGPYSAYFSLVAVRDPYSIASINLDNISVAFGAAPGTKVGSIAVSTSDSSPFVGTLTIDDTTHFQVNGSDLVTKTSLTAGTNYPVVITATDPNSTNGRLTGSFVVVAQSGASTLFSDDFSSISLYNYHTPTAGGTWQPASWFGAGVDGEDSAGTWIVNPFNPATPIQVYTASGGMLSMRLDVTPPAYLAACGNDATIGGQLQTAGTWQGKFGYWEIRCAIPKQRGSEFVAWMIDNSGQQEMDIIVATDQNGAQYAKLNVWTTQPAKSLDNFFFSYNMAQPVDPSQFHTYGIDLQSSITTFYIDRVAVKQFPTPLSYVSNMFWILLYTNAADEGLGQPLTSTLPSYAVIDYATTWPSPPFLLGAAVPGPLTSLVSPAQSVTSIIVSWAPPTTGGTLDTGTHQIEYKAHSSGIWLTATAAFYITPSNGSFTDAAGNTWTVNAAGKPVINGTFIDTPSTVRILYKISGTIWQLDLSNNWYSTAGGTTPAWNGPSSASPLTFTINGLTASTAYDIRGFASNVAGTGAASTPIQVTTQAASQAGIFTVTQANGIRDSSGNRWELRGYNCWWGEYNNIKANLFLKFPGANLVRIVCDRNTTVSNIQSMITELTGRNMVCFIDYHDAVYSGTIAWYQTMTVAFKNNPLCFMETPNEPGGNVAQDQINIINALRAAGWTNPIGLELTGGYIFDNVGPVMQSVAQSQQIFLCPHNYGDWWNNNGNMQATANATGLYSVVDEFGDSNDGSNVDSNGALCVQHIIQSQQAHQNGAAFWSATNGYHEGDNLFLDTQGNTLSSMGVLIQQMGWLA